MRIHLLSVPNTRTTAAYPLDGFCARTQLFARLLKRLGHTVYLYGVVENEAPCDEFVSCLTADEQASGCGSVPYQSVSFDGASALFTMFNVRAAQAIRDRKQPGDLIATIAGSAQWLVSEWHPELPFLEYSIGYRGVCAPFRVFQSHAWRHTVYGFTGVDGDRPFDAVIPPWFDADAVPVSDEADDYVVYCGRLVSAKGVTMACRAAREAGVRLVVIGHGDPSLVTYGDYLGAVPTAARDLVLSRARAVLMPTLYVEPFGNVAAEAQLCGTPVLASTWGAFTESIKPGVSGYRCSTLGEYVEAIDRARWMNRRAIRDRAVRLYGEDAAARAYASYFRRLGQARDAGVWSTAKTLPDDSRAETCIGHLPEMEACL